MGIKLLDLIKISIPALSESIEYKAVNTFDAQSKIRFSKYSKQIKHLLGVLEISFSS